MIKIDVASRDLDTDFNIDGNNEIEKVKCVKNLRNLLSIKSIQIMN